MNKEARYEKLRQLMVSHQLAYRNISDQRVLTAMRKVPRHKFIPIKRRNIAYEDRPVAIGENQTISQPYIVAYMTQLLHLQGHERVLEIGTGSGYQAAILAEVTAEVDTVERHPSLAERAAKVLNSLGYSNIHIHLGDGSKGWSQRAPYDAILVTAAAPLVPQPLLNQLNIGGRLVLPVGDFGSQLLQLWHRDQDGFSHDDLVPVAFVPLRGRHGWQDETR